ncbi:hypothetical protein H1Z61_17470 [Bacillus aquiflavi]|uniref:Uncharacterized protein n=1 Tax=Bacillus aquiflavi TaxID=2672567 RepID=A0A6B3W375_9BACI|nr:hypothetical protein [Bacillus aquiflavi]MBA4538846.1 hypothetical protein [Bacillus aquiflavi]NEY83205.1 hypothetical protein [Bacillus aquiflavi]
MITEATQFNDWIIEDVDKVLFGESDCEAFSGNRSVVKIKRDTTVIEDFLEGMYDDCKTFQLYEIDSQQYLVIMLKKKKEELKKEHRYE